MSEYSEFYKTLRVGGKAERAGFVTTLNVILPGAERLTEDNLGYRPGRLSEGYFLGLLMQNLVPEDFDFGGTTLRSDGRLGLPSKISREDDSLRKPVRDDIIEKYGSDGYLTLQNSVLKRPRLSGPNRIVKLFAKAGPIRGLPPSEEYPMGGGGLQWIIREHRPRPFFIALRVDPDGTATTPEFSVSLAGYDAKHRVRKYLESPDLF